MNKIAALMLCIVSLLPIIIAGTASAADEDTQASVYLVFDPVSGEFVTVDDAEVTAQHKARLDQEAIESGTGAEASAGSDADESSRTRPAVIAVIAILLGGAFFFMRSRKKTA